MLQKEYLVGGVKLRLIKRISYLDLHHLPILEKVPVAQLHSAKLLRLKQPLLLLHVRIHHRLLLLNLNLFKLVLRRLPAIHHVHLFQLDKLLISNTYIIDFDSLALLILLLHFLFALL